MFIVMAQYIQGNFVFQVTSESLMNFQACLLLCTVKFHNYRSVECIQSITVITNLSPFLCVSVQQTVIRHYFTEILANISTFAVCIGGKGDLTSLQLFIEIINILCVCIVMHKPCMSGTNGHRRQSALLCQ
jgi:hypothetical protein